MQACQTSCGQRELPARSKERFCSVCADLAWKAVKQDNVPNRSYDGNGAQQIEPWLIEDICRTRPISDLGRREREECSDDDEVAKNNRASPTASPLLYQGQRCYCNHEVGGHGQGKNHGIAKPDPKQSEQGKSEEIDDNTPSPSVTFADRAFAVLTPEFLTFVFD